MFKHADLSWGLNTAISGSVPSYIPAFSYSFFFFDFHQNGYNPVPQLPHLTIPCCEIYHLSTTPLDSQPICLSLSLGFKFSLHGLVQACLSLLTSEIHQRFSLFYSLIASVKYIKDDLRDTKMCHCYIEEWSHRFLLGLIWPRANLNLKAPLLSMSLCLPFVCCLWLLTYL